MTTVTTNFQYQSNRSTTQKYSVELKLIYTASVRMKIASTEVQSLTPHASNSGRKNCLFAGRNLEQSKGHMGGPSCWWVEEKLVTQDRRGGHKGDRNRHLHQTELYCLGCCEVTLAFRTVQWRELVPLSYKRSNSNVPKEAVITISTTILCSITSTNEIVNSHRPQTPNCP